MINCTSAELSEKLFGTQRFEIMNNIWPQVKNIVSAEAIPKELALISVLEQVTHRFSMTTALPPRNATSIAVRSPLGPAPMISTYECVTLLNKMTMDTPWLNKEIHQQQQVPECWHRLAVDDNRDIVPFCQTSPTDAAPSNSSASTSARCRSFCGPTA